MNRSRNRFGGSFEVDGQAFDPETFGTTDTDAAGQDPHAGVPTRSDDGRVRLQKALAGAGVASRRACETLITRGRVRVNGETVWELGTRIDPTRDAVQVDGVIVQLDVSKRYFVLNKPTGVVSTMADDRGRRDLREFTDQFEERLYNVGRLDTDTSGLLILTNDGELAHRLAHPKFEVPKTYVALVEGRVTPGTIQRLKDGISLEDGPIRADAAKLLPGGHSRSHSLVELTLHSGKNRIVRRMLVSVGHPVEELVRRSFGPLHLGSLGIGEMRELSDAERGALLTVGTDSDKKRAPRAGSARDNGDKKNTGQKGTGGGKQRARNQEITAGRPGDGKGARGMRGIAAKGNPHGRGRKGTRS